MGEWKIGVTLRMRGDLRAEMIAFAEQEKRSLRQSVRNSLGMEFRAVEGGWQRLAVRLDCSDKARSD
jgi:hypothetical protein